MADDLETPGFASTEEIRAPSTQSDGVPVQASRSMLCRCPSEVLQNIVKYLSLVEEAVFALTCKSILHAVGPQSWANLNGRELVQFLMHFGPDIEGQVLCPSCQRFHNLRRGWLERRWQKLRWRCGIRSKPLDGSCAAFSTKLELSRWLPEVNWATLYEVMKRHRLGAGHGKGINVLQMEGHGRGNTHPFFHRWCWNVRSWPRIRKDRLLLLIQYSLQITAGTDCDVLHNARKMLAPLVCEHSNHKEITRKLKKWLYSVVYERRAVAPKDNADWPNVFGCQYCRAEYVVETRCLRKGETRATLKGTKKLLQVSKYMDLGRRLPTDLSEWQRFATFSKAKAEDIENLGELVELWHSQPKCDRAN